MPTVTLPDSDFEFLANALDSAATHYTAQADSLRSDAEGWDLPLHVRERLAEQFDCQASDARRLAAVMQEPEDELAEDEPAPPASEPARTAHVNAPVQLGYSRDWRQLTCLRGRAPHLNRLWIYRPHCDGCAWISHDPTDKVAPYQVGGGTQKRMKGYGYATRRTAMRALRARLAELV